MTYRVVVLVSLCILVTFSHAQKLKSLKPKKPIVCFAKPLDEFTVVQPPKAYLKWKDNPDARVKTATFEVTYVGFTNEAKAAFQKAVDIWSTLITSSQTIHVYAEWAELESGVLGAATWGNAFANFPGAQQVNTYYPVAMAEKMARMDLNPADEPDIVASFSNVINWSYKLDGTTISGKYDLVTVVLHELGHGLGWIDSYSVEEEMGSVGEQGLGFPIIYDHAIENKDGQKLFQSFLSPSATLRAQLVSKEIYFNSPQVVQANNGQHARIYAPSIYSAGSSISHLDEATFPGGNINSLMTPQIGSAEVIHDAGPVVKGGFSDMGWIFTTIEHDSLNSKEDVTGPFVVTAKIISDAAPVSNIKLLYNSGGSDTEVTMTPTGTPNEYVASITSTGVATTYQYYIRADDTIRTYTTPGKMTHQAGSVEQTYYSFTTGPDSEAPVILHSPKEFILNTDTELKVVALVKDNLGVESVRLNYSINDVAQPSMQLLWNESENSSYTFTLPFPANSLNIGDIIKYRITARDTAVIGNASGNLGYSPSASGYHVVNVTGFQPPQDLYSNNFNAPTLDFIGEGFSITTPEGFTDGAIHTEHPYLEGDGYTNAERNLVYQLLIPVRIKATDATFKFDEIVLVEPGANGAEFGEGDFFDFVIVEGSANGGATWKALGDGYDSRANADWLTRYNSSKAGNNSIATGDASLYRTRTINLLNSFAAGQEVIFRFRLYSDQYAAGWGWTIDNLKIQIDDTPPEILHDHIDYLVDPVTEMAITTHVTDASGIESIEVEYGVAGGELQASSFTIDPAVDDYALTLQLDGFSPGDKIQYRIKAKDKAGNENAFPETGFITTIVFKPAAAINLYLNNFNEPSDDFIGNFFNIETPSGFTDGAISSNHFYKNGLGLNLSSSYTYMLAKPVIINAGNPYMRFDEIAIVEGHSTSSVFGNVNFNDYVIVEGSADGGVNWKPFLSGYDAAAQSVWLSTFKSGSDAAKSMFRSRTINMLAENNFEAGDEVLVRFRLYANETKNGWGWIIDNLSIQGPVTGIDEDNTNEDFILYPNPVIEQLTIRISSTGRPVSVSILNIQGQLITSADYKPGNAESFTKTFNLRNIAAGIYVVKLQFEDKMITKKFVKEK